MSRIAAALLFVSATVFGLMHLDGWTFMKFPDTFISGILFGYVYIQYGIHATVVMHSAFDMTACFDLFAEGTGTGLIVFMAVLGAVLLVRSAMRYREYIPDKNLHEPYDGGMLALWERD